MIPNKDNSPYAVEYRHGWTVRGPLYVNGNKELRCHYITLQDIEPNNETLYMYNTIISQSVISGCSASLPLD